MSTFFFNPLLTCSVFMAVAVGTVSAASPISPKQFEHLKKEISPKAAEEKWLEIPWEADLWAARQTAARQGKPILLWEMDGHPLGCT